jgi:hypothetical protein
VGLLDHVVSKGPKEYKAYKVLLDHKDLKETRGIPVQIALSPAHKALKGKLGHKARRVFKVKQVPQALPGLKGTKATRVIQVM